MGVNIEREDVLFADWGQRRSMLIASGDFPTFVPVVWGGEENAWWTGGALLPISEYTQYMPHFQHFVEEWGTQAEIDTTRQEDGRFYNLRGMREMPNIEQSFAINVDLFEAAGAPTEFATFDDFAAALKIVQEHGDVDYAYSPRWNTEGSGPLGGAMQIVAPNFGTSGGWNREVAIFDEDKGEFVPRIATDGYRELVQWFADLRAAGALDPEITQDDDAAVAKFINGRSAVIETNPAELDGALRRGAADIGNDLNIKMITVPAGPAGDYIAGGQLGPGFVLNASIKDSPYFLATLQFLDWLYFSEEGREFALWGVEGETFERGEDGYPVLVEALGGPEANATEILQQQFGFRDGVWLQNWGGSNALLRSGMTPEIREWHTAMADAKTARPVNPAAPMTESESEQANLVMEATQSATEAGVANFILGNRSMDEWDAFVQEILSGGAQQITDLMNTAFQRAQD
jgi:putative aldouronate transport system substrate-binding protein